MGDCETLAKYILENVEKCVKFDGHGREIGENGTIWDKFPCFPISFFSFFHSLATFPSRSFMNFAGRTRRLERWKTFDKPTRRAATRQHLPRHTPGPGAPPPHAHPGCIAGPEAVRQAVGGGCQSGRGRLLSLTSAIEAGTCRQGKWLGIRWAPWRGEGGGVPMHPCLPDLWDCCTAIEVRKGEEGEKQDRPVVHAPWANFLSVTGVRAGAPGRTQCRAGGMYETVACSCCCGPGPPPAPHRKRTRTSNTHRHGGIALAPAPRWSLGTVSGLGGGKTSEAPFKGEGGGCV